MDGLNSTINSAEDLEVYEEVGRGGFGVVYRGIIKNTKQEVAIKQIDLEQDASDIGEIVKEIQIISECKASPQITQYVASFVRNYKLWVIMEYVDGGSIFDILKPGPVTDEKVVSAIIKEILLALQFLHNQGKIHRDLKSQNILLSKHGQVKLTDFGVSTQLSSNFSRRNTTVGTPYWMAPEVIVNNHGGHSFKADIWSLGCCAYELFTGKPPLQTDYPPMKALRMISKCQHDRDFVNLIQLSGLKCSSEFKDFLSKCFKENCPERYSATRLLNHKFITKHQSIPDKEKLIKKLITRKQLWDQSNHALKTQHFYIPTEVHNKNNKIKWSLDDDLLQDTQTVVDSSPSPVPGRTPSPKKRDSGTAIPKTPASRINYASLPKLTPKQNQYMQNVQPEFARVLTKVFTKLETRNNLSTEQYDLLVSLNDQFIKLLTFVGDLDEGNNKIVIFQYLKYLLKELTKENDSKISSLLQRLIIPSNFVVTPKSDGATMTKQRSGILVSPPLPSSSTSPQHSTFAQTSVSSPVAAPVYTEFDEIENSLLNSWIEGMKDNQKK